MAGWRSKVWRTAPGVSDLGTLRVSEGGRKLRVLREHEAGDRRNALYAEHLNQQGKTIDFGPVRTDGSVLLERDGSQWGARTFPRDRAFTLLLDARRFGQPTEIRSEGGRARSVTPIAAGTFWKIPLNGATQYQWNAR